MDFLDNIYLDNSVRAYLAAFATLAITWLLKKYLSRYIAALLYRLVHRIWKTVDKISFVDLVVDPLQWFLLISITVFTIDKLTFPQALQYNIYHINTQALLDKTGIAILVFSFTWLMLRLVDFIALVLEKRASLTADKSDDQLIVFFRDFLKVILGIIGLLMLLKFCFNQDIGNLLTGLSIVGAALALAARESLENIIASFIIFFDKPFSTGDTLKVHQVSGTVERIGLRSTRIRTGEKTLVSVPNKQMVDSIVDNLSMRTERRADIKLELMPRTSSADVKKVLEGIKSAIDQHSAEVAASSVHFKEINKGGLLITAEFFTNAIPIPEFEQLKQDINFSIKEMLEQHHIEIAEVAPGAGN